MQTKKWFVALLLLGLIINGLVLYGQDLVGDAWLMSENQVVALGQEFTVSIHVNTGTQKLAAYTVSLQGNSSFLYPDKNSIAAGPDGSAPMPTPNIFVIPIEGEGPYPVTISVFDVNGKGPGVNLNISQLRFKAVAVGTSVLSMSVTTLSDPNTSTIGTPRGISLRITVVDPAINYGDPDNNGKIDILDALNVARYSAGLIQTFAAPKAGDVNADGAITILDAILIAQYTVGVVKELPFQTLAKKSTELVPVYPNGIPPAVIDSANPNLSVKLRDTKGSLLAGEKVYFYGDSKVKVITAITDQNGVASAQPPVTPGSQAYTTTINAGYDGSTMYLASRCGVLTKMMPTTIPTPTPTLIPTPTPTSLLRIPYYLPESYVSLSLNSTASGTIVNANLMLPDPCTGVDSWGAVARQGNTFSVDTVTSGTTQMCIQVISSAAHGYNLGILEQGGYVFNFYNMGRLLKSLDFVIMN